MPPKKTPEDLIATIASKAFTGRDAATLVYRGGLAFMLMFTWNSVQKTYDIIQSVPDLIQRVDRMEKALKDKGIITAKAHDGN